MTQDEQRSAPKEAGGSKGLSRERVRLGASFLLGALAVLFAGLNFDEVEVNWIVGTWETPLIVVIVVCLLLGGAIGSIVARRLRTRRV